MIKIITWQCGYCRKQGDKPVIKKHETTCVANPSFKACSSCKHEDTEWWNGNPNFSCKLMVEHSDHDIDGNCESHEVRPGLN